MKLLTMPTDGAQEQMLQRQIYVDNLITTTWYDVRKKLFGDIFKVTPLLDIMEKNGKVKQRVPDGTHFEIPIAYGKLKQNQKWFGRGDTFGEAEAQFMTRLLYPTRNFGDSIVRMWDDERKNRGNARVLNYVEEVIANHKASFAETLSEALWSAAPGAMEINSLPSMISTTPTVGTVGGIDRSKNPYLVNQVKDMSGLTIDANLLDEMETMWNNCSKWKTAGRKSPDMIVTTQTVFERYQKLVRAMGVYSFSDAGRTVDLGAGEVYFKGVPIVWDLDCPAGTMYFLNTDTMEFCYDPSYYMQMTEWKTKHNALDRYAQVITVCNLVFNNFMKNGVIHSIATT